MVPPLVLGPIAGVLLDRVTRPRRMLILADLSAAAAVAACAVAAYGDVLSVAWLAGLSCALGLVRLVVEGLYFPHLNTMEVADLRQARGRLQSTTMLSRSAGASLGGSLVTAVGTATMFVGDVLTYLFSTCCLLRLKSADRREVHRTDRPGMRAEFLDGVRVLSRHGLLAAVVGYLLVGGVASGGIAAQRAVFLLDDAGLPVALFGIPAVAATLLAAAGAVVAPRVLARGTSPTRMLLGGELAAAVGSRGATHGERLHGDRAGGCVPRGCGSHVRRRRHQPGTRHGDQRGHRRRLLRAGVRADHHRCDAGEPARRAARGRLR